MGRLKALSPRLQRLGAHPIAQATGATPASPGGWVATSTRSTTERGYGWAWQQAVMRIRARDSDQCQQCARAGAIGLYAAVDHIVPKSDGGSDDDGNLEVICDAHHKAKTARESGRARRW